jgi:hypothetical protein
VHGDLAGGVHDDAPSAHGDADERRENRDGGDQGAGLDVTGVCWRKRRTQLAAQGGRDWRAFFQITGPWALLVSAGLAGLAVMGGRLDHDPARGLMLLLALLALVVVLAASIPIVGVAWRRWIVDGRLPARFVALPNRAMWGWFDRLYVFGVVLGGIDRWIVPNVAALASRLSLPASGAIGDAAATVADVLAVMLVSNMALRLPAVAIGDRDFALGIANTQGRKLWPGLPFGLVLSVVPFYALGWLFDQAYDAYLRPKAPSAHVSWPAAGSLGLSLFIAYAAVASAATFLSRTYVAVKTAVK